MPRLHHAPTASSPSVTSLMTARLHLRCYSPADAESVWTAISESRSSLAHWVPDIGRRRDVSDVRHALATLNGAHARANRLVFGIWNRASGGFVGEVGLYEFHPEARTAELGYWIRQNSRGRGYATEAARALLNYASRELGLRCFEAHVANDNIASVRVVEGLGFHLERQRAPSPRWDGNVASVVVYAWYLESAPA